MTDPVSGELLGALISTGKEALGSVPADLVAIAGGDWLHHIRIRNASRLEVRTREILKERGKDDKVEEVSPAFLLPLIQSAADESREELLELWARLLASAADPQKRTTIRKSFITTLQQFDPIDAPIFEKLWEMQNTGGAPNKRDYIVGRLKIGSDVVAVSFDNLFHHRCIANPQGGTGPGADPYLTEFGRELGRTLFE